MVKATGKCNMFQQKPILMFKHVVKYWKSDGTYRTILPCGARSTGKMRKQEVAGKMICTIDKRSKRFVGAAVLLQPGHELRYVFVGRDIIEFILPEPVLAFRSKIAPNDLVFSWIETKTFFFMLSHNDKYEHTFPGALRSLLSGKTNCDPYDEFNPIKISKKTQHLWNPWTQLIKYKVLVHYPLKGLIV